MNSMIVKGVATCVAVICAAGFHLKVEAEKAENERKRAEAERNNFRDSLTPEELALYHERLKRDTREVIAAMKARREALKRGL
jgi:hypothetical protein